MKSPPSPAPRLTADPSPVTLRGAPYRPGELPFALALVLPAGLAEAIDARARERRLPVELLVRAMLDAERAVLRLAPTGGEAERDADRKTHV